MRDVKEVLRRFGHEKLLNTQFREIYSKIARTQSLMNDIVAAGKAGNKAEIDRIVDYVGQKYEEEHRKYERVINKALGKISEDVPE